MYYLAYCRPILKFLDPLRLPICSVLSWRMVLNWNFDGRTLYEAPLDINCGSLWAKNISSGGFAEFFC